MKALYGVLVVATAVTLASVAAAGPAATKQGVKIDLKISPQKTFTLTPLESGALERDSGKLGRCDGETEGGAVVRDGQEVYPFGCRAWTITGKRGTLVLRTQAAWAEAGGPYNIATGTWKVVRGTGQYAGSTGSGRIAQVGRVQGRVRGMTRARYQGFLTSR